MNNNGVNNNGVNNNGVNNNGVNNNGVNNNGKLQFRLGLAASLVSICLSAYLIAHAQTGPSWEVPVAILTELQRYPILSITLAIIAVITYLSGKEFSRIGDTARLVYLIVLLLAFILPLCIWIFKPEQWPFQFETLSFFASILIPPVWLAAAILFWLAGFRWINPR